MLETRVLLIFDGHGGRTCKQVQDFGVQNGLLHLHDKAVESDWTAHSSGIYTT